MSETLPTTVQVLVKCLEEEGVKYIFGIPGEENLDLMQAIKNSSIRFITVRHEQSAAFMADVYGRLTGEAGVCLATLGPGATNLITGIADAYSDGAPLVAITGQVGTERMHLTTHQYLNLCELFEPITKRAKQVVRPDTVSEIVRIAFKYAEMEKPGACLIDVPVNIGRMEIADSIARIPLKKPASIVETSSNSMIAQAVCELEKAKHPVVLVGHSAVRSKASDALTKFANLLHIPVVNTMMAKGMVPYTDKYAMWTVGIPQKDYANEILDLADTIVCVGYDLVEYAPQKWNPDNKHKIIHIDTSPAHINKLYQPVCEVVGDISDSLMRLAMKCGVKEEPTEMLAVKEKMVKEFSSYDSDFSFPPKPQKILSDVRKVMGKSDIVISDVGAHKMWIARQYNCFEPNTCIISNGFATMGIAVPGAFSAKLINPNKKVLAISGDGGFMMNSQDLETAVREHVNIVVLIFNDSAYGLIKWKQDDKFGEHNFVDFSNPDFVMLAEAMHCKGFRIEKTEDLYPTLEKAFTYDCPVIIDCPVDYRENNLLTKHLKEVIPS